MTKQQIVALFRPGQRVTVMNHYINRPDHPCYGIQTRTVARVNQSSIWFHECGAVHWPSRAQIITNTDGSITLLGGGCGQRPSDPFLTIKAA